MDHHQSLSALSAPTVTFNTLLRPYPQYSGGVSGSALNIANSIYHGVQFQYEKQFSHGLSILAHYTIAKLIDDSSFSDGNVGWLGGVTDVQNPLNLRLERAVSAQDIPQRLVTTFSYQLPIGKGKTDRQRLGARSQHGSGRLGSECLDDVQQGFPAQQRIPIPRSAAARANSVERRAASEPDRDPAHAGIGGRPVEQLFST